MKYFTDKLITSITYSTWVQKPHCTLQTVEYDTETFAANFSKQTELLLPHSFIAKQQSSYLRFVKSNLKPNECIVMIDYSENYAFVVQNAIAGFHWNNDQATIYTVMIYYTENNEMKKKSLCIISDYLDHNANGVYIFNKMICNFVKSFMSSPEKFYYFSDGAPSQYKNFKNFINLYFHFEDFGIEAEWNFFATSHGKGPCDGIGGTLKRLASRASLTLPPSRQILTPIALFEWASNSTSFPTLAIQYAPKELWAEEDEFLNARYANAKKVPETLKTHQVIPDRDGLIKTKFYSFSDVFKLHRVLKK